MQKSKETQRSKKAQALYRLLCFLRLSYLLIAVKHRLDYVSSQLYRLARSLDITITGRHNRLGRHSSLKVGMYNKFRPTMDNHCYVSIYRVVIHFACNGFLVSTTCIATSGSCSIIQRNFLWFKCDVPQLQLSRSVTAFQ